MNATINLYTFKARHMSILFFSLLMCIVSLGCHDEPDVSATKDRNIIFYIVAENNLHNYSDSLLEKLKGIGVPANANVIAYVDGLEKPCLYKVGNGLQPLLKYDECNSVSPHTIRHILNNINKHFPAKESGLVLWSHGSGWLNVDISSRNRAFGQDRGNTINLTDLFAAMDNPFDYIIFDACNMSCIETIAEAENKCRYIIASPYAVPANGLVNENTVKALLSDEDLRHRLIKVCQYYVQAYENTNNNISVALCSTIGLSEIIAHINNTNNFEYNNDTIANLLYFKFRDVKIFFDANESFSALGINRAILDKTIMYSLSGKNNKSKDCGLSIFIPQPCNSMFYNSYRHTVWNKKTAWLKHFNIEQQ